QRMTWRASRWHILNVSVWNVVQTVFYASIGERSPWKGYIHNDNIENYYPAIKQFCYTSFHNGMILVFIESIIVFVCPFLDNSLIFSMIWFMFICLVGNGCLLFTFLARFLFLLSCGRCFSGKRTFTEENSSDEFPIIFYPTEIDTDKHHLPPPQDTTEKMDVTDETGNTSLVSSQQPN
ncbi:hypothetical protein PMAYCL1PPCAC_04775, partial [Pristionchus mayeri]